MMKSASHGAEGTSPPSLEHWIKAQAYGLGFDLVGITTLSTSTTAHRFDDWIASGFAGDMHYLERGAEKRRDFRSPFPGVRSAIVVALDYGGRSPAGPVARYARGDDYHDVMGERLRALHRLLEERAGHAVAGKAYVDTGPLLERELAQRAGLGWFGKNTNLVNPRLGSWFFIGSLLIDIELAADEPFSEDHCGTCTRCLDACPTEAFVAPRVLDARRCISYLTIESRGDIPEGFQAAVGENLYGCDICQEVCPWNVKFARELPADSPFAAREIIAASNASDLAEAIIELDDEAFRTAFRHSPMKRARLAGLKRNARVVLSNVRGLSNRRPAADLTGARGDPS